MAPDNQKMRQFHTFAKMNCQMPASILQFSAHSSSNSFKFDKKCQQKPKKKPNPHAWPPAGLGTLLPYYQYTNTREARKCQQSSIIHFGPLLVLCCWSRSPPALLLIQQYNATREMPAKQHCQFWASAGPLLLVLVPPVLLLMQ